MTERPTTYITIRKPGNIDKMYHELDKATANDGLVRAALTVLQDSVHNITMETNKLNLHVINHKQQIDQLESKVSRWLTVITIFDPHLSLRGIQPSPLELCTIHYLQGSATPDHQLVGMRNFHVARRPCSRCRIGARISPVGTQGFPILTKPFYHDYYFFIPRLKNLVSLSTVMEIQSKALRAQWVHQDLTECRVIQDPKEITAYRGHLVLQVSLVHRDLQV